MSERSVGEDADPNLSRFGEGAGECLSRGFYLIGANASGALSFQSKRTESDGDPARFNAKFFLIGASNLSFAMFNFSWEG